MTKLIAIALVVLGAMIFTHPATAECRPVACYRDCYWVAPNVRRCDRRCQVQCFNNHRSYAPTYSYAPVAYDGPPLGGVIAVILLILGAVACLAAIASGSSVGQEIASIEQSTAEIQAKSTRANAHREDIEAYIAAEERAAFRRGERAAEEEWEEYTRHG